MVPYRIVKLMLNWKPSELEISEKLAQMSIGSIGHISKHRAGQRRVEMCRRLSCETCAVCGRALSIWKLHWCRAVFSLTFKAPRVHRAWQKLRKGTLSLDALKRMIKKFEETKSLTICPSKEHKPVSEEVITDVATVIIEGEPF
ncbi:hypothetical protein TNCV_3385131 [Trichonephila clavipes]|uniref:Uncharacterized protein n=1 Tax=Trichonephila clavipes TaxID=2585209 RepID=A0A8X6VRI7_TRICX|nr:hypothetical protein TNCV_3385131 [Trichonephila clavipes]